MLIYPYEKRGGFSNSLCFYVRSPYRVYVGYFWTHKAVLCSKSKLLVGHGHKLTTSLISRGCHTTEHLGDWKPWIGLRENLQEKQIFTGKIHENPWFHVDFPLNQSIGENHGWLVVSTPLNNISQIGSSSQLLGEIKNVPNHQPDGVFVIGYHKTLQ